MIVTKMPVKKFLKSSLWKDREMRNFYLNSLDRWLRPVQDRADRGLIGFCKHFDVLTRPGALQTRVGAQRAIIIFIETRLLELLDNFSRLQQGGNIGTH